jgi:phenylpyruvate tautomerase PptA (4-oxalocrotonate tautomerase family)
VPLVTISALPQRDGVDVSAALVAVTHAVAAVLREPPRGTWAVWETIEPGRYVEGGDAPALQPRSTHPPIAVVRGFEGRPPAVVERILVAVADALVEALGLEDGNAFVAHDTLRSGELYTGGAIARTEG